jgi:hypothetical protein
MYMIKIEQALMLWSYALITVPRFSSSRYILSLISTTLTLIEITHPIACI